MNIFISGFAVLSVLCAILFIYTRTALTTISDAAFRNFQRVYLVVYLLAMGEWALIVGINILLNCKSVFLLVHFHSLCMEEFWHKTTPLYDQLLNCVKHLKNCNIWSNWLWQNRIGLYDQIKLLGNDKRSIILADLWKKNMILFTWKKVNSKRLNSKNIIFLPKSYSSSVNLNSHKFVYTCILE